jgi:hypothetical protein
LGVKKFSCGDVDEHETTGCKTDTKLGLKTGTECICDGSLCNDGESLNKPNGSTHVNYSMTTLASALVLFIIVSCA